ncbi:hypothetical protein [Streptomyces sp. DSM 118878]
MMVSGAFAVTLSVARRGRRPVAVSFALLTLVLLYALAHNIVDKPDGITISGFFIAGIIFVSPISRVSRTTELRADRIVFDEAARRFITDTLAHDNSININIIAPTAARPATAPSTATSTATKSASSAATTRSPARPTYCSWRST